MHICFYIIRYGVLKLRFRNHIYWTFTSVALPSHTSVMKYMNMLFTLHYLYHTNHIPELKKYLRKTRNEWLLDKMLTEYIQIKKKKLTWYLLYWYGCPCLGWLCTHLPLLPSAIYSDIDNRIMRNVHTDYVNETFTNGSRAVRLVFSRRANESKSSG